MSEKLTKAQRSALKWFAARESAHLFGAGDPSLTMVRRLEAAGYVAVAGREPGKVFGFTKFGITPAGRAALEQADPKL